MTNVRELADGSTLIYQVDTTNVCNATCTYCPQPTHKRPRGEMTMETFEHVLRVARNRTLSLHHFGEPLLHPQLEAFVRTATESGFIVGFSTNGKRLTQERLDRLAANGLGWIRLHTDPFGVRLRDFVTPAGLEFTEHRLLVKSDAPKKSLVSFSGYLDLPAPIVGEKGPGAARCSFIVDGWRVACWTGDLALCCNDVEGSNDAATLCSSCDGYRFRSPHDWLDYAGEGQS